MATSANFVPSQTPAPAPMPQMNPLQSNSFTLSRPMGSQQPNFQQFQSQNKVIGTVSMSTKVADFVPKVTQPSPWSSQTPMNPPMST